VNEIGSKFPIEDDDHHPILFVEIPSSILVSQ
jgi:hypothetical protein